MSLNIHDLYMTFDLDFDISVNDPCLPNPCKEALCITSLKTYMPNDTLPYLCQCNHPLQAGPHCQFRK